MIVEVINPNIQVDQHNTYSKRAIFISRYIVIYFSWPFQSLTSLNRYYTPVCAPERCQSPIKITISILQSSMKPYGYDGTSLYTQPKKVQITNLNYQFISQTKKEKFKREK